MANRRVQTINGHGVGGRLDDDPTVQLYRFGRDAARGY